MTVMRALSLFVAALALVVSGCAGGSDDPEEMLPAPEGIEVTDPEGDVCIVDTLPDGAGFNCPDGDGAMVRPPEPLVTVGQPFRTGPFRATIEDIEFGVTKFPSEFGRPNRPENGQFILVHMSVKNVGRKPDSFSIDSSNLVDTRNRIFAGTFFLGVDQDLGYENMQPGTSDEGFMVFDVPKQVKALQAVQVQSDAYISSKRPVVVVTVA